MITEVYECNNSKMEEFTKACVFCQGLVIGERTPIMSLLPQFTLSFVRLPVNMGECDDCFCSCDEIRLRNHIHSYARYAAINGTSTVGQFQAKETSAVMLVVRDVILPRVDVCVDDVPPTSKNVNDIKNEKFDNSKSFPPSTSKTEIEKLNSFENIALSTNKTISDNRKILDEELQQMRDMNLPTAFESTRGMDYINTKTLEPNPIIKRWWTRRYDLFRRFDDGIEMDDLAWCEVTPEVIADFTARSMRLKSEAVRKIHQASLLENTPLQSDIDSDIIGTSVISEQPAAVMNVIDACCGVGGNVIAFASVFDTVMAVDNDPDRIRLTKHNVNVYGFGSNISYYEGDFINWSKTHSVLGCGPHEAPIDRLHPEDPVVDSEMNSMVNGVTTLDGLDETNHQLHTTGNSDCINDNCSQIKDSILMTSRCACKMLPFEWAFLSPPWGGPGYNTAECYSLVQENLDALKLIIGSLRIAMNVAVFLPKKQKLDEIMALAASAGFPVVEILKIRRIGQSQITACLVLFLSSMDAVIDYQTIQEEMTQPSKNVGIITVEDMKCNTKKNLTQKCDEPVLVRNEQSITGVTSIFEKLDINVGSSANHTSAGNDGIIELNSHEVVSITGNQKFRPDDLFFIPDLAPKLEKRCRSKSAGRNKKCPPNLALVSMKCEILSNKSLARSICFMLGENIGKHLKKINLLITRLKAATILGSCVDASLHHGQLYRIDDPTQLRSKGGVFYFLVKSRYPAVYAECIKLDSWELEKSKSERFESLNPEAKFKYPKRSNAKFKNFESLNSKYPKRSNAKFKNFESLNSKYPKPSNAELINFTSRQNSKTSKAKF